MRKIRFRAWDKVSRQMVSSGNLMLDATGCMFWQFGYDEPKMLPREDWPLMQSTGLRDKNGVEIYEGDILDFDETEWGGKFTPEIVPSIQEMMGSLFPLCGLVGDVPRFRQVIGNIHENPELLGE